MLPSIPTKPAGFVLFVALFCALLAVPLQKAMAVTSGDAYVNYDSGLKTWTIGTARIEKVVQLSSGNFLQTKLLNKITSRDYLQGSAPNSDEFSADIGAVTYNGSSGGWIYDTYSTTILPNTAIQLTVTFHNGVVQIARNYVVYPSTGVIEEWSVFKNVSGSSQSFINLTAVRQRVMQNDIANVDLYLMTGDKAGTVEDGTYHKLLAPLAMAANSKTILGKGGNRYHEFMALRNRTLAEGLFVSWDYTEAWKLDVGDFTGRIFAQAITTYATAVSIANLDSLKSPVSRTGVFVGDIDDMGNTILDFTYQYKWDYTSSAYFPLIRFGGYGSDPTTVRSKIDENRYIGGDMVWIDDGWQDYMGDWNNKPGESNQAYRNYAAKNSQTLGLWLVPWGAEAASQIAAANPTWMVYPASRQYGLKLDLPASVAHIRDVVTQKQIEFGNFMMKTDFSEYSASAVKSNNIMSILEEFKVKNPNAGLYLCSGGGGLLNMQLASYSDLLLQRDGSAGSEDGYYTSLLYPTEKLTVGYGRSDIGAYSKNNRSLLSYHLTIAGSLTATQAEMEPLRVDANLYRYLKTQGVMGRYVEVYRPTTSAGVNKEGILQKLSGDGTKGYITFAKNDAIVGTTITVYPKRLTPALNYTVATLEGGKATTTQTGSYWMTNGITLTPFNRGEVIFFNLQNRPMAGTDSTAPTAPGAATKIVSTYLGITGVEMNWTAGTDNNWISYYEIFKNGAAYDKVSKGTFYFDKIGTTADSYQVRTVDGDANVSSPVTAYPTAPSIVVDNSDGAGVTVTGSWTPSFSVAGYYGSNFLHDGATGATGGKKVTFTPTITTAGKYHVYARWTAAANRDAHVPIDVNYAGGLATVSVDQRSNNGTWVLLGTYSFNAGTTGNVAVRNDGTTGFVVADAVQFVLADWIVDNTDAESVTTTGTWNSTTSVAGYYGSDCLQDGNTGTTGGKKVKFTPNFAVGGSYDVYVRWTAFSNRASNTPVDVVSASGTATYFVDQRFNNGTWVLLGTFTFNAGMTGNVTVRNDGANGFVIADAVRFLSH